jgi:hypothetical protein
VIVSTARCFGSSLSSAAAAASGVEERIKERIKERVKARVKERIDRKKLRARKTNNRKACLLISIALANFLTIKVAVMAASLEKIIASG